MNPEDETSYTVRGSPSIMTNDACGAMSGSCGMLFSGSKYWSRLDWINHWLGGFIESIMPWELI